MKKPLLLTLVLLAVCAAVFAGGGADAAAEDGAKTAQGTKGAKSIFINPPELAGFDSDASALLNAVVDSIRRNFINYSGMKVSTAGDVPDYFLNGRLEKLSSGQYTIILTVDAEKNEGAFEAMASSALHSATTLDKLKYGSAVNLATRDLFDSPNLGVKLTAAQRKKLEENVNTELAEGGFAAANAATSETSFGREQYRNVAEGLGQSLAGTGRQLSVSVEAFVPPKFDAPVNLAALTFAPPAIRTLSGATTVAEMRGDIARSNEMQRANKAVIEEQQQELIRQRDVILVQWQNFLGDVDKQREILREEEQKLLREQEKLEASLREGEEFYKAHPPFRILYNNNPEIEIDYERATADMRFEIAAEPTSVKALADRLDLLAELNKSFASVNGAFEDVNRTMAAGFVKVEAAMDKVKDAMEKANAAGSSLWEAYRVVPVSTTSTEWKAPPGKEERGRPLKTSWPVDYSRRFALTVSLLAVRDDGDFDVIESQPLSLLCDTSWNGPLNPESAFVRSSFNNVNVNKLGEGRLVVWVGAVNGVDANAAAQSGYIEIIPDEARTAAVVKRIASRTSWRRFWSDTNRFNSIGVAAGTTMEPVTPAFLVSPKLTFSPFSRFFIEAGSDIGLIHGERDVQDVGYLSVAPYLHLNLFTGGVDKFGGYVGVGGGVSFSQYTYPSESHIDPVTVITPTVDANMGMQFKFARSVIDLRSTIRTNFKGLDLRLTLGYAYRFGYFAARYGGNPAHLTNQGTKQR
ncbi:MAG: hypothetical protein LBG27_05075 [Spirochaetaceae bacterium]|jgi:hypothetical protein|nr:hypothetical protein [Spirochaetaceae bacterium]